MAKKKKTKTRSFVLILLVVCLLVGAGAFYIQKKKEKHPISIRVVLVKKVCKLTSEKISYTTYLGQSFIADGVNKDTYHVYSYYHEKKIEGYLPIKDLQVYHFDPSFENNIALFPESYRMQLRYLHALYPQWVFSPMTIKRKFNKTAKTYQKKALTSFTASQMIASNKIVEGNVWRRASLDLTRYVLDPRNALYADRAVVFEQMVYNSAESLDTIKQMLKGTALEGNDPQSGKSYAELLQAACLKYNISLSNIAARAKQENGAGGLGLKGGQVKGKTYYNIFNIGANTGARSGIVYASKKKWTTRKKAIYGGVAYICHHYVNKNQITLYLQRFDLLSKKLNTNIYMTNITAPIEEARHMMDGYVNTNSAGISRALSIPVYKKMPDPVKYPIATLRTDLSIITQNKSLKQVKVSYHASQKYTGNEITPKVTLKDGNKVLKKNVDYYLSYASNKTTGKGKIHLIGLNDYYGKVTKTFTIA